MFEAGQRERSVPAETLEGDGSPISANAGSAEGKAGQRL